MTDVEPAQPDPVDASTMPADIAAFVERMQGYCVTLATIGTPDAFAAADALCAAMDTMSTALRLSKAAMAAVTPTEH